MSDVLIEERTLWNQPCGIILTSGTLAVGSDFCRFRQTVWLPADSHAVKESVFLSPFDYRQNCLLYPPRRPPRKRNRNLTDYYNRLADATANLIRAAHVHRLALFTSYAELSAVEKRLRKRGFPYPMFTLRRNAVHTVERFRKTPGSRRYADVIAALPAMERIRCFQTIKQFYRVVKLLIHVSVRQSLKKKKDDDAGRRCCPNIMIRKYMYE